MPDLVPLPYRTPQAALDEVSRQLSQHDLDLVQDWVIQHIETLRRTQREAQQPNTVYEGDAMGEMSESSSLPHALKQIEQAAKTGSALQITYHSPYHDGTTTRIIEPFRIEQHDLWTYIIAYCHLARDERTFRLDRIQHITAALSPPKSHPRTS